MNPSFPRPEKWKEADGEPKDFERFAQAISGIRAMLQEESYAEAEVRAAALLVDTDDLWEEGSLGRRDYEVRVGIGEIYRVISSLQLGRGGHLEDLTNAMRNITEPLAEKNGGRAFWWHSVRHLDDVGCEIEGAMAVIDARQAMEAFWPPDSVKDQIECFLRHREIVWHAELVEGLSAEWDVPEITRLFFRRQLDGIRLTAAHEALDLGMYPDANEVLLKVDLDRLHGNHRFWFTQLLDRMHEENETAD